MLSDCMWHFKVLIIRLKCLCLFDFVPVFWHQRSHSCIFHKSLAEMKTHYNFLFRIRPCVVVHNEYINTSRGDSVSFLKTRFTQRLSRILNLSSDHNLVKTKNRSRNRSHKCDGIEEQGAEVASHAEKRAPIKTPAQEARAEALCDWFSSFTFTWDSDKPAFTRS